MLARYISKSLSQILNSNLKVLDKKGKKKCMKQNVFRGENMSNLFVFFQRYQKEKSVSAKKGS